MAFFPTFRTSIDQVDSLSDDEKTSTPPQSPRSPSKAAPGSSFRTPEKLKAAEAMIHQQGLLRNSPGNRSVKRTVEEGLQVLQDDKTPSPFKKKKGAEMMGRVYDELEPTGLDRLSLRFHEETSRVMLDEGLSRTGTKIISAAAKAMQKSPYKVVNVSHLNRLEKTGGYHLHLPNSPVPIKVLATNPVTQIRFVIVDGKKSSTIFPDGTSAQDVIEMVNGSRKIAEEENRTLRMTSHGYVIECYNRDHILNVSTFPVFFYAEFGSAEMYHLVDGCSVSLDEVVNAACDPRAKIVYRNVSGKHVKTLILDLAPVFQDQTKVSKGILFRFNRAAIPDCLARIFIEADKRL
jgi:hypothetical protein